jgi:hypothetical protein
MSQGEMFPTAVDPADIVYTPEAVSKHIINFLAPSGVCLDPCKGDGAFYKFLPQGSLYCELREGSDFLQFKGGG